MGRGLRGEAQYKKHGVGVWVRRRTWQRTWPRDVNYSLYSAPFSRAVEKGVHASEQRIERRDLHLLAEES